MKKDLLRHTLLRSSFLIVMSAILFGCSKSEEAEEPQTKVYEYDAKRSHCDPLIIAVSNQTVTITTTDTVITNIGGSVEDCDYWTDANGIPDCHYIEEQEDLHNLPFMALIGKFGDEYFLVGKSYKHYFSTAGNLELSVNDWGGCGVDSDNAGKFVISVQIE